MVNQTCTILLYKLSNINKDKIKKYFSQKNKNSNINYNIIELDELENYELINNSNVFIVESNYLITDELKKIIRDKSILNIRVTDKPISLMTNSIILLSLSFEFIDKEYCFFDNKITHFEYSMDILEKMIIEKYYMNEQTYNSYIKQNSDYLDLLIKIIYLIDAKDNYTKKHCENVSKYAVLLGKELQLNSSQLEFLRWGGLLHDIGKIGISENILNKKTKLTDNEYKLIKNHTIIGETFIPKNRFEEIRKIIRSHHEKIDGKGYPDGLKGNEIPLLARIVAIADSFDAMTTQRTYNKRKTLEEAINELYVSSDLKNNSIQFDVNLVRKFEKMIRNNEELLKYFSLKDNEVICERQKQLIRHV